MATPVNLNQYRKQKARAADKLRGDRNAVRFGRSKSEQELARARTDKDARDLDGHKKDP